MNYLVDIIPARYRRYLYGVAALAALVLTTWQASGHDWRTAGVSLLGSLVAALAHANTDPAADLPELATLDEHAAGAAGNETGETP